MDAEMNKPKVWPLEVKEFSSYLPVNCLAQLSGNAVLRRTLRREGHDTQGLVSRRGEEGVAPVLHTYRSLFSKILLQDEDNTGLSTSCASLRLILTA